MQNQIFRHQKNIDSISAQTDEIRASCDQLIEKSKGGGFDGFALVSLVAEDDGNRTEVTMCGTVKNQMEMVSTMCITAGDSWLQMLIDSDQHPLQKVFAYAQLVKYLSMLKEMPSMNLEALDSLLLRLMKIARAEIDALDDEPSTEQ